MMVAAQTGLQNSVFIVAVGAAKKDECLDMDRDPSFRKATLPMMMAWRALEKAVAVVSNASANEADKRAAMADWGLVFGTSHGELEVTRDFLVTLATKGLARPILFQNSLHHSTLGFISLKLGISGPGITVSNHFFSGEDAISAAVDLIEGGHCDVAVTLAVDTIVTGLEAALGQYYPGGKIKGEGAGCLILANEAGLKRFGVKPIAGIGSITINHQASTATPQTEHLEVHSDYDADGVEKIALYLQEAKVKKTLSLRKPDGTSAIIRWQKLANERES
jgi:3-oxoacyl-(acyl-carrier-protein) synthase